MQRKDTSLDIARIQQVHGLRGQFVDARPAHRELLEALPSEVERALVRALALRPAQRFSTPVEFAGALERPMGVRRYSRTEVDRIVGHGDLRRDVKVVSSLIEDRCVKCDLCYIACRDGGHQAIKLEESGRLPEMDHEKCPGCRLCVTVCPADAIEIVPAPV